MRLQDEVGDFWGNVITFFGHQNSAMHHRRLHPNVFKTEFRQFYVDDCLTGAETIEKSMSLQQQLNDMLEQSRMTLRKWRSDVLATILSHLRETEPEQPIHSPAGHHKALGVH